MNTRSFLHLALFLLLVSVSRAQDPLSGAWELLPSQSTDIDLYGTLSVRILPAGSHVTVVQRWGGGRSFLDSLDLPLDGTTVSVPVTDRVFPSNVFMGLMMVVGEKREVRAHWDAQAGRLIIAEKFPLRGSQGVTNVNMERTYELSANKELLLCTYTRSTRTTGPAVRYEFKKAGSRHAYAIRLDDDWEIRGGLPQQAFFISLQGVANKNGPLVYLLYPENWAFTYVQSVYDFYRDKRHYTFTELRTAAEALRTLKQYVKGYVVWDQNVRTSLIVAFTIAGLERAVVVSEGMIPLVEQAGLKPVEDLRGRFTGQNDAQIYSWAKERYWKRCSKECIIWLGGEHGTVMKPAVADWGMHEEVFFNDLSSRPADSAEYKLANALLAEMKPMSMVMGWHSYAKDMERDHVKLTSTYGHRVEGLNTLPNLSFSAQIPASPGFQFKNNHHLVPGKTYTPEKKVYISCIQTDGIGLGAWLRPGRGEIPYAWEVLMNYTWMAPGMAEYFYTLATPNDFFVGCLSGPGYLYPKAVPKKFLGPLIATARGQMKDLDLNVFETMDYSEGATVEGNTDLPKAIVDEYYKGMPEAIGFINGYAPSYTFTSRNGRPFVSYDYYLSPSRPEADAAADLEELARVNPRRPYFLLFHVRESSDVKRVKSILDRLGPEFEVVPLDIFLTLAGKQPTFEERYRAKGPSGDKGTSGD
jgi:hypothetical protein